MQDHDRAVVLGSQSFGKGLVQTVIGINQDTALKITNSKYYIPSGRSLQKREFIDDDLIADSEATADSLFQTKAGRTVVGGGGITPDLIVKDEGSYPLAASILRSGGYFKFVQENNDQYTSRLDSHFFLYFVQAMPPPAPRQASHSNVTRCHDL